MLTSTKGRKMMKVKSHHTVFWFDRSLSSCPIVIFAAFSFLIWFSKLSTSKFWFSKFCSTNERIKCTVCVPALYKYCMIRSNHIFIKSLLLFYSLLTNPKVCNVNVTYEQFFFSITFLLKFVTYICKLRRKREKEKGERRKRTGKGQAEWVLTITYFTQLVVKQSLPCGTN